MPRFLNFLPPENKKGACNRIRFAPLSSLCCFSGKPAVLRLLSIQDTRESFLLYSRIHDTYIFGILLHVNRINIFKKFCRSLTGLCHAIWLLSKP